MAEMCPYRQALSQFICHMLSQKHCEVESKLVLNELIEILTYKVRDIALRTSIAACHAGRSSPCYFDLERTFRMLGIRVSDLRKLRIASAQQKQAVVNFGSVETCDEEVHQSSLLDMKQRGVRSGRHIPKYMPPFPSVHTYKNTMMNIYTDRSYDSERERRAEHQLNVQKAINRFYLGTQPTTSLFCEPQYNKDFLVLTLKKSNKPAFLNALMPRDGVFDVDIYEFNDVPNEKAKLNMYMIEPQLEMSAKLKKLMENELELNLDMLKDKST